MTWSTKSTIYHSHRYFKLVRHNWAEPKIPTSKSVRPETLYRGLWDSGTRGDPLSQLADPIPFPSLTALISTCHAKSEPPCVWFSLIGCSAAAPTWRHPPRGPLQRGRPTPRGGQQANTGARRACAPSSAGFRDSVDLRPAGWFNFTSASRLNRHQ